MINCFLPAKINRSDYNLFKDFFNAVCGEFFTAIIGKTFNNLNIQLQNPKNNNTIYHIMSKEDYISHKRCFDNQRAEKIPWIKYILFDNNCKQCENHLIWGKLHTNNRVRWYIYCKDKSYVIILEEYKSNIAYLVTAFNVTPQKSKELLKSYQYYIEYGIK
jgi:hypothetical protein